MIKGSSSLCLPANKTWVSVGFSARHTAEDFGWLLKYPASRNQDLVAVSDGEIIAHHKYSDGGNTVVLGWNYGNHDYYALYMHNKAQSPLKVGTVVKQGEPIAVMGNTGNASRGEHVHLILIKAPKGVKYDNNALRKYRIAPSSYPMYVYPNQEIVSGKVNIKPLPKVEEVKSDKAFIKKGAKSKSLSAKYNNLSIASSAIGVPLDYELNKVKGKDWVYFPSIQTYVDIKDVDFENKPQNKPQQVSNVGKTAQLRGKVNLYPNATTKTPYKVPSGRSRNLKILDEANGRLKVRSTAFNPQTVWVNAKDVKIV